MCHLWVVEENLGKGWRPRSGFRHKIGAARMVKCLEQFDGAPARRVVKYVRALPVALAVVALALLSGCQSTSRPDSGRDSSQRTDARQTEDERPEQVRPSWKELRDVFQF